MRSIKISFEGNFVIRSIVAVSSGPADFSSSRSLFCKPSTSFCNKEILPLFSAAGKLSLMLLSLISITTASLTPVTLLSCCHLITLFRPLSFATYSASSACSRICEQSLTAADLHDRPKLAVIVTFSAQKPSLVN